MIELLRRFVHRALVGAKLIDGVLHVLQERKVCTVHDQNVTSSNLAINSSQATEDDVVEHEQGVLINPIPRRVEVSVFERLENQLDIIDVSIVVLLRDRIQLGLEDSVVILPSLLFEQRESRG